MNEQYPKVYFYRRLVQAKLFIDTHYAEDIDVGNIADEAYFSKFHFIREFRQTYGKTPHQYLIFVRVEKAKDLLKTGMPVSDVCYGVGFASLSSFSGLFKRIVHLTPSNYLLRHQNRMAEIVESPLKFVPGCFAAKNGWTDK